MSTPMPAERVPAILRAGADTFEQRREQYGDTWLNFGRVMHSLFPDGLHVQTEEDWRRLGIVVQCAGKLQRYSANLRDGGHRDSAHDLSVYAAMLEALCES